MPAPYVKELTLNGQTITSVVLDQADFDALIDEIEKCGLTGPTKEACAAMRTTKSIPAMMRGTKTEQFFKRFGVKTDIMGVVVRGAARRLGLI